MAARIGARRIWDSVPCGRHPFWLFYGNVFSEICGAENGIRFCSKMSTEFERQIRVGLGLAYFSVHSGRKRGVWCHELGC